MTLATQVAGLISAGCSITLLALEVWDRWRRWWFRDDEDEEEDE